MVMEGRDIGSVVFPLASAKIYLEASLEARAERRLRQYRRAAARWSATEVAEEVAARDRYDSERDASPLRIPPDAMVIDNSDLNLASSSRSPASAVRRALAARDPDPDPAATAARTALFRRLRLLRARSGASWI